MISIPDAFSASYAQARKKFLEAAATASLPTQSFNHPLPGRDGETLAMDVTLDGAPDAKHLLIVSSACHGVEGYCGSGVQVFALHDADWRAKAKEAGVAVLYIHALNPHGFSHVRRVTHENVDLNRNFSDYTKPLPVNASYAELHALMLPKQWPPATENIAAHADFIKTNGLKGLQDIITRGQHTHADGLFFGGTAPTWSNSALRTVLRQYGRRCAKLAWIDLHTGLGPRGLGERIFACRDDKAAYARAQAWWGNANNPSGATPVTSIYDGSSSSAFLTGLMWQSAYEECPQAEYTAIAMEYGTQPMEQVMQALRADHWLHLHPEAPSAQHAQIKQQMMEAFYCDADDWKGMVVSQARQAMFQAADGLRSSL
jgi:predicted deacylase